MAEMTPTPDTALAARLATRLTALQSAHTDSDDDPRQAVVKRALYVDALIDAHQFGQLITISDHNDAVQAAVAKAVDDTFRSCRAIAASRDTEDDYGDEIARVIEERRLLAAAIRARKGDAL